MNQLGPVQARSAVMRSKWTVIILLTIVSTLNYLDRNIVNILVEPIKHDLKLADGQLGLITGLSFALLYSTLGIPIARFADRSHRPAIIAVALFVWSASTLACGFAASFVMLLLARSGVAAGEAGATPPAHSLISDYTTPLNRASALAIFSLGAPLGSLIGLGAGGLIADMLGWRWAFVLVAIPGILLAPVIVWMVREPRGREVAAGMTSNAAPLSAVARELAGKPSFWWLAAAAAGAATVTYGHGAFYGSYFLRQHGAALAILFPDMGPLASVGLILGVVTGVSGVVGTFVGGFLTDLAVAREPRGYCRVPMIAMLLAAPAFALVLLPDDVRWAIAALIFPAACAGGILGPTFAAVQAIVAPTSRATAAAVLLFLLNIIGLGLGPLIVGTLSDRLAASLSSAEALRWAMVAVTPMMLVSAFCYWRAYRVMDGDMHVQ